MVLIKLLAVFLTVQISLAFPFVVDFPKTDDYLAKRQQSPHGPAAEKNCPYNPDHPGAAPITPEYPYNHAKNGIPGRGEGGYKVPADGDTAHYYTPPDPKKDIRGPCPGLNTMANHNFISHDGISTFNEIVDASQNVFNMAYEFAVFLVVIGLTTTTGDTVTERLSIGCDATHRTSFDPKITGSEPGLDAHNKFELDASLAREDYFIAHPKGDNYNVNTSRFADMVKSTGGLFNRANMAKYRYEVYQKSLTGNPNFYFGPFAFLQYGASSFLYRLFPSGTRNYVPDLETISSFFGVKQDAHGDWKYINERIPPNWTNTVKALTLAEGGVEVVRQYKPYPVLFGGNTGNGSFDVVSGPRGMIKNGHLGKAVNERTMACFLYMLATERIDTSLNGVLIPTVQTLTLALSKLQPGFDNLGCPFPLT